MLKHLFNYLFRGWWRLHGRKLVHELIAAMHKNPKCFKFNTDTDTIDGHCLSICVHSGRIYARDADNPYERFPILIGTLARWTMLRHVRAWAIDRARRKLT